MGWFDWLEAWFGKSKEGLVTEGDLEGWALKYFSKFPKEFVVSVLEPLVHEFWRPIDAFHPTQLLSQLGAPQDIEKAMRMLEEYFDVRLAEEDRSEIRTVEGVVRVFFQKTRGDQAF